MTSRTTSLGVAALAGAAVLLLAGCGGTSGDGSQASSGTTSVASSATTSAAGRAEGGATAAPGDAEPGGPAPTRADGGSPAPTAAEPPTSPVATSQPAADSYWDPCTLPESDITAAGLNAATKERIPDPNHPAWKMCRWQAADQTYSVVIAASDRTTEDLLEPGTYQDLRRTEFYRRQVVQYRSVQDTHKLGCYIGTPATFGSIVFTVRNTRIQTDVGDPCADANHLGAALFRSLPA
ncbi:DUF3558 family protein [Nocardia xishanensis]|uniref:DUF3558 family protein n=1 Tax=Nocardia xishanensis TaxID=238964 RepID=UPI003432681B